MVLQTKYPDLLAQLRSGRLSAQQAALLVATNYENPPADKIAGHVARAGEIAKLGRPSAAPAVPQMNLGRTLLPDAGPRSAYPGAPAAAGDNIKTDVNIGTVVVNTQAKDAAGISKDISRTLADELTAQSNRGLQ